MADAGDWCELDIRMTGLPQYASVDLNLNRAYREFCSAPKTFDDIFARWLASIDPGQNDIDTIDPSKLIPFLKDRAWVASQNAERRKLLGPDATLDLWLEEYDPALGTVYAQYRTSLTFCRIDEIARTGIPTAELRSIALRNLATRTAERKIGELNCAYLINAGGNFDASHREYPYPVSPLVSVKRPGGTFKPLDFDTIDHTHPIPNRDVIDVRTTIKGGRVEPQCRHREPPRRGDPVRISAFSQD